jgi:hypothetical protein
MIILAVLGLFSIIAIIMLLVDYLTAADGFTLFS